MMFPGESVSPGFFLWASGFVFAPEARGIAHTGRGGAGVKTPAPFPCLSPAFALVLSIEGKNMTDAETLAKYEAARDEVLTDGHTVSVDGREWKRDNLDVLEKLIDKYRVRVRQASGSVLRGAGFIVPGRMR